MAFWTDSNLKEPLRQNRWYLEFGTDIDQFKFALKECKKPEYEISFTEHRLLTHYLKYPGLLKWKPIDIKYVSARGDKLILSSVLNNIITLDGAYINPNNGHQQISKDKFKNLSGYTLSLSQVNSNGEEIERWEIYNPFIASLNYGSLTYENDGFVDISFTLNYDWAFLAYDALNADSESGKINPGFPSGR